MTGTVDPIADRYRRFAEEEAQGHAPSYEALARHVAVSAGLLSFLATLPPDRQQPNLFLAAVRLTAGRVPDPADLEAFVRQHGDDIRRTMLTRHTQTNEPGRCATLLPVLAALPQPLALLEVGASAGLCLLPDCYDYDFGGAVIEGHGTTVSAKPVLTCRAGPETPLPEAPPTVVWRAGLDLNPLDVSKDDDRRWLETLVWPEQTDRLARLQRALDVAAEIRPAVTRGDLLTDLPGLAAEAPPGATLVVFHTAVLAYIADQALRDAFMETVSALNAVWISNESPRVFPSIAERAPQPPPKGAFLMSVDAKPVAWTGPHGQSLDWIG